MSLVFDYSEETEIYKYILFFLIIILLFNYIIITHIPLLFFSFLYEEMQVSSFKKGLFILHSIKQLNLIN
jgi:hypothetical protein